VKGFCCSSFVAPLKKNYIIYEFSHLINGDAFNVYGIGEVVKRSKTIDFPWK